MHFNIIDLGCIDYAKCLEYQRELVKKRRRGDAPDTLIFAVHPPVITIGRRGTRENVLASSQELECEQIAVYRVDRGGDVTYHGQGQLVIYPIIDLRGFKKDLHWYLRSLEQVVINLLERYNIFARRKPGFTGVWIEDKKIAFIGIAAVEWITYHGLSINVSVNLKHFANIRPCGIMDCEVTNLSDLVSREINIDEIKINFYNSFFQIFEKIASEFSTVICHGIMT
ncbi:MAG: lipoyl(octanoyl) transferase LipB [Candidatus Omnitrophota bacterium]